MHAFLAFFLGTSLQAIVFRVMSILGLGVLSYAGSQVVLQAMLDLWLQWANQLDTQWLGVLGFVNVDRAISLIFSAATIKYTVIAARKFIGVRS